MDREAPLLAAAPEIEGLAGTASPHADDLERLTPYLAVPAYRRHFFAYATPGWLPLLLEARQLGFEEPSELADGRFRVETWDAGEFVGRCAASWPPEMAKVFHAVRTDNWSVIYTLASALQTAPPEVLGDVIDDVLAWGDSRFFWTSLVPMSLARAFEKWANLVDAETLLKLLTLLTRWNGVASPWLEGYAYKRLLESAVASLGGRAAERTLEVFARQLALIAEADEAGTAFLFRLDIADTGQPFGLPSDDLIDAVRDTLLNLALQDPNAAAAHIQRFLRNGTDIHSRIALFVLARAKECLPLVTSALSDTALFDLPTASNEALHLAEVALTQLPALVVSSIRAQAVAMAGIGQAALEKGDEAGIRDAYSILHRAPPNTLDEAGSALRDSLAERVSALDAPNSSAGPSLTEAVESGPAALILAIRARYHGGSANWFSPGERAWAEVRTLVRQNPDTLLQLAPLIEVEDLPAAWHYFDQYLTLAREGVPVEWPTLVPRLAHLISSALDAKRLGDLTRVVRDIARGGVGVLNPGVEDALAGAAKNVLSRAATLLEDFQELRGDASHHQLNSAAGHAADALVAVALRQTVVNTSGDDPASSFPDGSRLTEELASIVRKALEEGWGGIELRFALGASLPQLAAVDRDWLLAQIPALLPALDESAGSSGAWLAFWAGYLFQRDMYRVIVEPLLTQYAVVIRDAFGGGEQGLLPHAPDRELLIQHLALGWFRSYPGFDALMDEFLGLAEDEARARLVSAIGHVGRGLPPGELAKHRDRLEALWVARTQVLAGRLGPSDQSKEASEFASWLPLLNPDPTAGMDRLLLLIRHAGVGLRFEQVLQYMRDHVEESPDAVAALIRAVADRMVLDRDIVWFGKELQPIVAATWTAAGLSETARGLLRSSVEDLLSEQRVDLRQSIA